MSYSDNLDINKVEFELYPKAVDETKLRNTKQQLIIHLKEMRKNEFKIVGIPKQYSKDSIIKENQNDEYYDYFAYHDFQDLQLRDSFIESLNTNNYHGKIIERKLSVY